MLLFRCLLPAALLLSISASGQRVLLGLKGGGDFAKARGADAYNSQVRLGGHGGLLTRLELPAFGPVRGLGVQVEALYTIRGDNGIDYGFTIGHRLDYLDMPLLLQYHGRDGLFVEAGAQYSYLLHATPNQPPPPGRLGELTLQSREISFLAGFGFQDSTGVSVGWRYVGGLNNVFRPGEITGSGQRQLRNSSVELYLNYLFEPRQVASMVIGAGRGVGRGTLGAARLVGKAPRAFYQAARFVFYTGPAKLLQSARKPKVKDEEALPEPPTK